VTRGGGHRYVPHLLDIREVVAWFLTPQRVGYYLALRVVRAVVLPLVRLSAAIAVKRCLIGRFSPGRRDRSQWVLFKHWLMAALLPGEKLQDAGHLLGAHYAGMSRVLRALGASVGERVYWPGSSFEGLVEYDLFEVPARLSGACSLLRVLYCMIARACSVLHAR